MLTEDCIGRVTNWKFASAAGYLTDIASDYEREMIEALNRLFGNSGWFNGDMGVLVSSVVRSVLPEEEVID